MKTPKSAPTRAESDSFHKGDILRGLTSLPRLQPQPPESFQWHEENRYIGDNIDSSQCEVGSSKIVAPFWEGR
jgi:hypothetical protein